MEWGTRSVIPGLRDRDFALVKLVRGPGLEPGRGLALRILSPVLYSPHVPVKAGFTPSCNRVASLLRGDGIHVQAIIE